MDYFQKEIINFVLGIITGIVGTVLYNKPYLTYEKLKREKVKAILHIQNIFESCDGKSDSNSIVWRQSYDGNWTVI